MSQAEAFWAPGILDVCSDASSVACGHLSLHDYRKFLSQPEGIDLPDELKGRTLRRKPAASNLNQARTRQEFWFSLSSPLSSAPSSPPPLSYSQSVITLQSDNETQDSVSPLGRPLTTPASQTKQPVITSLFSLFRFPVLVSFCLFVSTDGLVRRLLGKH